MKHSALIRRLLSLTLCGALALGISAAGGPARAAGREGSLQSGQVEPEVEIVDIPWQRVAENGVDLEDTAVKQYTFTFSTVPASYEDIVQYELDSPYKTMALLAMAFRA